MICPLCNADSIIIRTYGTERERQCLLCKARWTTIERMMELKHVPPQMVLDLDTTRRKQTNVASAGVRMGGFVAAPPPAPVTDNVGAGADGRPGVV